jgi:hypothetical protein
MIAIEDKGKFGVNSERPKEITVDRAADAVRVTWLDNHVSVYPLRWLRGNPDGVPPLLPDD